MTKLSKVLEAFIHSITVKLFLSRLKLISHFKVKFGEVAKIDQFQQKYKSTQR